MHELQFADACKPARCIVLRLQLLPYSVGHELLLLQQRNSLLLSGFETLPIMVQRQAVIEAADICSQTWEQNHFTPGTWWQKRQTKRIWDKWERAVKSGTIWPDEMDAIQKYFRLGSGAPRVEAVDGPAGRQLGAPFHAGLIQFLIQTMGCSNLQAYDYPFGLAKFHYYTHAESEGAVKIVNAPELEFDEYCRTEDAKEAAEIANRKSEISAGEATCRP